MKINVTVSDVTTYVSGIGGWSKWNRFDEIDWCEICCTDECAGCRKNCWDDDDANCFWSVFSDGNEIDCSVCWNVADCTDNIEISEITEKDNIDLNTCCENAAENAVQNAAKNAVKDAVENVAKNAMTNADRNVKNAAEKIF